MKRGRSARLFREAQGLLPGGVNSPVRAFGAVGGGIPPFVVRAKGSRLYDADGNVYLDYVCSWGAVILGHADPAVVRAVERAARSGLSFGAPTPAEVALAREVRRAFPSVEMLRLVSSGTEAVMSAVRLARAATGRDLIVKFDGGYHGHADPFLVAAGSGAETFGVPSSRGVPRATARLTAVLPYNDAAALRRFMSEEGRRVAAVVMEPVAANMGVLPPRPRFLETARQECDRWGALLVLDEVITGFRLAPGGAQEFYGIRADITCLGKVLGGGLPLAAYGASAELMSLVAPLGPVYQAGTLSGNPVAVAAGLATLRALRRRNPYPRLEALARELAGGLLSAGAEAGVPVRVNRVGSLLSLFFTGRPVDTAAAARRCDRTAYARFHSAMLDEGVYFPPSPLEALFLSAAHTGEEVARTLEAVRRAMRRVRPA